MLDQGTIDRIGPFRRQGEIVAFRTDIIGMAFDDDLALRLLAKEAGDQLDFPLALSAKLGCLVVEESWAKGQLQTFIGLTRLGAG